MFAAKKFCSAILVVRRSIAQRQLYPSDGPRFRASPATRHERSARAMRSDGGRGRIRTSVARKERQIYSLLVLATHPPVRTGGIEQRRPQRISEVYKDTKTRSHILRYAGTRLPQSNWDSSSPDRKLLKKFGRAGGGT